jgi:hypothetical protein
MGSFLGEGCLWRKGVVANFVKWKEIIIWMEDIKLEELEFMRGVCAVLCGSRISFLGELLGWNNIISTPEKPLHYLGVDG